MLLAGPTSGAAEAAQINLMRQKLRELPPFRRNIILEEGGHDRIGLKCTIRLAKNSGEDADNAFGTMLARS